MSFLKDSLEGPRAVDALSHGHVGPSWQLSQRWWLWLQEWRLGTPLTAERADALRRLSTHVALLVGILTVIGLARLGVLSPAHTLRPVLPAAPVVEAASPPQTGPVSDFPIGYAPGGAYPFPGGALERIQVPYTQATDRPREQIIRYTVEPGDTVSGIAAKFGLNPKTVEWANGLELNPDLLRVGQELIIPPVDGVVHVVESGDTLATIARRYKVTPEDIVAYAPNGLSSVDQPLQEKQTLIVPGGEKPFVMPVVSAYNGPVPKGAKVGTGNFGWPASGRLTSLFGQIVCSPLLGCKPHMGIDIAGPIGTPVVAADSGYVAFAGWDKTGYGKLVIINHGNGFTTLYAHMSAIFVKKGQSAGKGQRIGSIGKTGNVTGAHLHFEVRQHGRQRNPLGFLP